MKTDSERVFELFNKYLLLIFTLGYSKGCFLVSSSALGSLCEGPSGRGGDGHPLTHSLTETRPGSAQTHALL